MKAGPFIDSGAFIAFLDGSDRLHEPVTALFERPPHRWVTSILVVSETYSWFLHRLGEEAARTFRTFFGMLPNMHLLGANPAHHREVQATLDRFRGQKLSYVDASSLVLIREHDVSTVWGTDRHLAIEGATVVPGPTA